MKGYNPHRDYELVYPFHNVDDGWVHGRTPLYSIQGKSDEDHAFDLALNISGQFLAHEEEGFHLNLGLNGRMSESINRFG